MGDYHVSDAALAAYARDELDDTMAWSVEAHLDRCGRCRPLVTPAGATAAIVEAARLDADQLPARGDVRPPTRQRRAGLLIGAGPGARIAWLLALGVTVLLASLVSSRFGGWVEPSLLLLIAPALPVLGTAVSFGRHTDPLHELVASTPFGGLRILLWRTASVVVTSVPVTVVAGFASGLGTPVAWLLPSAALTALTLALAERLEPAHAAAGVGIAWAALVLGATAGDATGAALVTAATGPVWGGVTAFAAVVLLARRVRQETFR